MLLCYFCLLVCVTIACCGVGCLIFVGGRIDCQVFAAGFV